MKWLAVTVFTALAAAGCLSLDKAHPQQDFYVLEIDSPEPSSAQPVAGVLMVRPFRAAEPYGDVQFIYRVGPSRLETDYYNVFLTPPERMIRRATENWLRASNVFAGVVDGANMVAADYVLDAVVTTLRGDYSDVAAPRAQLAIQVTVIPANSAEPLLLQKEFSRTVAIDRDVASELVAGWQTALQEILDQVTNELREVCAHAPPVEPR